MFGFAFSFLVLAGIPSAPQPSPAVVVGVFLVKGGRLWAQGILTLLSRRWSIGPWTECSKSCNDGTHGARSRQVFCVEDSEGTEVEISESHCKKPKPTTHERCGRQPCPAEWYTMRAGPVGDLKSLQLLSCTLLVTISFETFLGCN